MARVTVFEAQVVHCRTGLHETAMVVCALLMHLQFCESAADALHYFYSRRLLSLSLSPSLSISIPASPSLFLALSLSSPRSVCFSISRCPLLLLSQASPSLYNSLSLPLPLFVSLSLPLFPSLFLSRFLSLHVHYLYSHRPLSLSLATPPPPLFIPPSVHYGGTLLIRNRPHVGPWCDESVARA